MAKQWIRDEKIKMVNNTKHLSDQKAANVLGVSSSTVYRWRYEIKKFGEKGLTWGNGLQSKDNIKKIESSSFQNMTKEELIEILLTNKNLSALLRITSIKEKFKKIEYFSNKFKYPIDKLCEIASVSRSGFYKWIKNGRKMLNKWDSQLALLIKETYLHFKKAYGYKMLTLLINKIYNTNLTFGIVYRYTKKLGLCAHRRKKRHKYNLTSSDERYDNKLNRNFTAKYYGEKLVTDISYLHSYNTTFYLSIVKDLWSGQIVDYKISESLSWDFVKENITDAKNKIGLNVKSMIHSDQGWHYTISDYKKMCKKLNLDISMSRRGNSVDNGSCESFFSSLKCETVYLKPRSKWKKEELIAAVEDYINFYNSFRPRIKYNNLSPNEFIQKFQLVF